MTASETLKLIAKQWCNLGDLMKLAGVGRNNAFVIKSTIKKKLESGSIIMMKMNNDTSVELGITIDYIRGKGFNITGLSNLLSEEL